MRKIASRPGNVYQFDGQLKTQEHLSDSSMIVSGGTWQNALVVTVFPNLPSARTRNE
jgi:hypothetical protein